jgi:predicted O-methyltransferase YrrM
MTTLLNHDVEPRADSAGQLLNVAPFEDAWRSACECNILVSQIEGRRLYALAQQAPENVLEVGSFHGGSAVLMAHAGVQQMTLIDPHTDPLLLRSLARFNLLHKVHMINYRDYQVWPCWTSKISFMFLDHEHTYLAVRNSLIGWRGHLQPGARIAIHDYLYIPQVKRGVDELAPELEVVDRVENLAIAAWTS